ncbi:MAG: error-prone DNA polymerase [Porticoccaceae bacterium]|nr:MAG: error-prone DNA polymerase [Porticoccaceae bacterium]
MGYAQLYTTTNYSFLVGASHPHEFVERAVALGYGALAVTDDCSLAGVVKAHVAARAAGLPLLVGSALRLAEGPLLLAYAPCRAAYAELSGLITLGRRRAAKGAFRVHLADLRFRLRRCLAVLVAEGEEPPPEVLDALVRAFRGRLWFGLDLRLRAGDEGLLAQWRELGARFEVPLVACPRALMHDPGRRPLADVLCAIRHRRPLAAMGSLLEQNGEAHLQPLAELARRYPPELLAETWEIARRCRFSLDELRYEYPPELVPAGTSPIDHLRRLVEEGKGRRWPGGAPPEVERRIAAELELIEALRYEHYFLTVHDLVAFAKSRGILCQGRGSAANSVVCYCLGITEIGPEQIDQLFERFISRERDEPPDIDVDFEHRRREEVIQYLYRKYGRERAALAAAVITYRRRSAVRDVGMALGLDRQLLASLAASLPWWEGLESLPALLAERGLDPEAPLLARFVALCREILGFPRHLSQHTGGFVIAATRLSDLVPVENAAMPERTVIQWDKEDLEALGLLKVDVLGLGILTALRRALELVSSYEPAIRSLADIPREDAATYEMLCRADAMGVFQVESRAQMAMLPRLQPRCFHDLVIQVAIVRPGPILGQMVHPYLRRRAGREPVEYPSEALRRVLEPTLGVPIFQEQVMRIAMIAAGFTGGEADALRRALTHWGRDSRLAAFRERFVSGLVASGHEPAFAERLFEQVKGFAGYGFPESHAASFALLAYASAWLKRHHPAAFYCALLDSQPLGFYSPDQLLRDARRHGVAVLPVDVSHSAVACSLVAVTGQDGRVRRAIRLGLGQVKGLAEARARAIVAARAAGPFTSVADLARRAGLNRGDLARLAAADALRSLAGDRQRARWASAAAADTPLLADAALPCEPLVAPPPLAIAEVAADYRALGFSLRRHPLALLRDRPPFDRCAPARSLAELPHRALVQVAGWVTARQRPSTARGVLFLTLEDETGCANVVVRPAVERRFRRPLLTGRLLLVKGAVEILREGTAVPVVHVLAGYLEDLSGHLPPLPVPCRDFH